MYSFLLIDDEVIIREGVRDNIDWASHGFRFLGACADGRAGIEAIDAHQPDVVLTDICMPFVDGLDLARYVRERYPHIKVVLLTGYDEFGYAQEAVKLRVADFILKPITAEELRDLLDSLRAELDREAEGRRDLDRVRTQLRESLPLLRERVLNRLVSGGFAEGEIRPRLDSCGLTLPGPWYQAMVIDLDSPDHGGDSPSRELLSLAIKNIADEKSEAFAGAAASELPSGSVLSFQNASDQIVLVLSGGEEGTLEGASLRLAEEVRDSVAKELAATATVGAGCPAEGLALVGQSYREALAALDHRLALGRNQVISFRSIASGDREHRLDAAELGRRLSAAIRTGTYLEIEQLIDEMTTLLGQANASTRRSRRIIETTLAFIIQSLSELGIPEGEVLFGEESPFVVVQSLKTLAEIADWLKSLLRAATETVERRRDDLSRIKAREAEDYIRANYGRPGLSLSDVCRATGTSTSYFCTLFKRHTDKTFIEYLTEVRIEKAKELFKTSSLRGYEIADSVGYSDSHYFSLIFKKITGESPSIYREKYAVRR